MVRRTLRKRRLPKVAVDLREWCSEHEGAVPGTRLLAPDTKRWIKKDGDAWKQKCSTEQPLPLAEWCKRTTNLPRNIKVRRNGKLVSLPQWQRMCRSHIDTAIAEAIAESVERKGGIEYQELLEDA